MRAADRWLQHILFRADVLTVHLFDIDKEEAIEVLQMEGVNRFIDLLNINTKRSKRK